jgi:hypothetical protein
MGKRSGRRWKPSLNFMRTTLASVDYVRCAKL